MLFVQSLRWQAAMLAVLCMSLLVFPAIAATDPAIDAEAVADVEEVVNPTLQTFASMLKARADKTADLQAVKKALSRSSDEVEQKAYREQAEQLQSELDELEEQVGILATGVSAAEFDLAGGQAIDLQGELEQLVQPFVIMLKSATAEARQIEQLKHKRLTAEAHIGIAEKALEGVEELDAADLDEPIASEVATIKSAWQEKLAEATDLQATIEHQLAARLDAQKRESEEGGSAFGDFFKDRGLSLLMGIGAAILVFTLLKLLGSGFSYARTKGGVGRSFQVRLSALLFNVFSVVAAIGVMLYIFNMRNDWLLLGLVVLLSIAILWMGLKMLPDMMEQITLLLNLGAVQEGERVMFEGVPWVVKKLDFYTDFENPELAGGTFTVPVRELLGLHSRPAAPDEAWFPSRTGDWVKTEDGTIGKIVFQSPEMVQMVELGGARHTFSAPAYFESAPTNLSSNARVEVEFGVSYKHQAIGGTELPEKLAAFVEKGLLQMLDRDVLLDVNVELLACNSSSLDYEVEADLHGSAADRYEDVERALTRLCLEACNEYGWEIPFPQLVVHKGD
ncbi:MAG: hypothetical protein AB8B48_11890 [Pseudomonadales bacterium]